MSAMYNYKPAFYGYVIPKRDYVFISRGYHVSDNLKDMLPYFIAFDKRIISLF